MFSHVTINMNQTNIEKLLEDTKVCSQEKKTILINDNQLLLYLIYSALNFKFWIDKDNYWSFNNIYGANGLFSALKQMIKDETNYFRFFDALKYEEFKKVLSSNSHYPLPYLKIRFEYIKEVIELLKSNFNGDVKKLISSNKYNAVEIAHFLSDNTEAFSDRDEFHGEIVYFIKKATFFIKLLQTTKNYNNKLTEIERLPVLSDYRIPQLLRYFNILEYSEILSSKVDNQIILTHEYEIEIRMATVMFTKALITQKITPLTILELDEYLWKRAKMLDNQKPKEWRPFHLVESTKY